MLPEQAQHQLAQRQQRLDSLARRVEVGGMFAATQRELQRTEKRVAGCAVLWEKACPSELLPHTAIVGLNRGVLTIGVSDHSTRYALDRELRSGLEAELVRRSASPLSKVRLVVQPEFFVTPSHRDGADHS